MFKYSIWSRSNEWCFSGFQLQKAISTKFNGTHCSVWFCKLKLENAPSVEVIACLNSIKKKRETITKVFSHMQQNFRSYIHLMKKTFSGTRCQLLLSVPIEKHFASLSSAIVKSFASRIAPKITAQNERKRVIAVIDRNLWITRNSKLATACKSQCFQVYVLKIQTSRRDFAPEAGKGNFIQCERTNH